jgi:hypothetical protein
MLRRCHEFTTGRIAVSHPWRTRCLGPTVRDGFRLPGLFATSAVAALFCLWTQVSPISGLLTISDAVWEFSLGVYLIVKGFKPSPITAGMAATSTPPDSRVPTLSGQSI